MPGTGYSALGQALEEAASKAESYDWTGATELLKRALDGLDANEVSLESARAKDFLAKYLFESAFQSGSKEEFVRQMKLSRAGFDEASVLYGKQSLTAFSKRAMARKLYANFWLSNRPEDKMETIGRCIDLTEEAAEIFRNRQESRDCAWTLNELLSYLLESLLLERVHSSAVSNFDRALASNRSAFEEFKKLGERKGMLECLRAESNLLLGTAPHLFEPNTLKGLSPRLEDLRNKLAEFAEKMEPAYEHTLVTATQADLANHDGDYVYAMSLYETATSASEQISDSFLTGRILQDASEASFWAGLEEQDPEVKQKLWEKSIALASRATSKLEVSSHPAWLGWVYGNHAESYIHLANFVETETERKKEYLRTAIGIAERGLTYESYTNLSSVDHVLNKARYFLATIETDPEQKKQLLKETLQRRQDMVQRVDESSLPSWNRGVARNYLALVKAELAGIEKDPNIKAKLLESSVSSMQECIELCSKWASSPGERQAVALYQEWNGDILLQLYKLTPEENLVPKALEAYKESVSYSDQSKRTAYLPSLSWKIAKAYDTIGDYKQSSHSFRQAADGYALGAMRSSGLSELFTELAHYMGAWSEIEDAKLFHGQEQHSAAAERYNKAAAILQSTKTWNHISKYYLGSALLEQGEALSREERQEESIEAFAASRKELETAKEELQSLQDKCRDEHQSTELREWIIVTGRKLLYCLARMQVEEAEAIDRSDCEFASLSKYQSASKIFHELQRDAQTQQERSELVTFSLFCRAWAKMKEGEARATPELYAEAADFFTKAQETATEKKLGLLALANASMCRALEAGTRFRRTNDPRIYSEIKKLLETSAYYYERGGFRKAGSWTKATQRLFDALLYMTNAEAETEPAKKAELFYLSEKHLEQAARTFDEAGFPNKKGEAMRYLKRAHEARELLLTPIEALVGNPVVSETSVPPVTLTGDQALGLERFEGTAVIGSLRFSGEHLHPGSEAMLLFEMTNVGRSPATLIQLENVVPEGFRVDRNRTASHIQDNCVLLKGKRLESMQVHEVRVVLTAVKKGSFVIRPRIIFANPKGERKPFEFEPATLKVEELGISGWIRGPR